MQVFVQDLKSLTNFFLVYPPSTLKAFIGSAASRKVDYEFVDTIKATYTIYDPFVSSFGNRHN